MHFRWNPRRYLDLGLSVVPKIAICLPMAFRLVKKTTFGCLLSTMMTLVQENLRFFLFEGFRSPCKCVLIALQTKSFLFVPASQTSPRALSKALESFRRSFIALQTKSFLFVASSWTSPRAVSKAFESFRSARRNLFCLYPHPKSLPGPFRRLSKAFESLLSPYKRNLFCL